MSEPNTNFEDISFSLLGDSFTLRCHKQQKSDLIQAIRSVQELSARILRDSPTLSPQQAAILTAIDSQSRLQRYMGGSTPFQEEATRSITEIKSILQQATQKIHS